MLICRTKKCAWNKCTKRSADSCAMCTTCCFFRAGGLRLGQLKYSFVFSIDSGTKVLAKLAQGISSINKIKDFGCHLSFKKRPLTRGRHSFCSPRKVHQRRLSRAPTVLLIIFPSCRRILHLPHAKDDST